MEVNKVEKARKLFETGFNCCQAVFSPFATEAGLSEEASLKISSGLGAGMSYNGETCGAVMGAHMVIGLINGHDSPFDEESKIRAKKQMQEFRDKFNSRHGSCTYSMLLGANTGVEAELQHLRENNVFTVKCPHFVDDSVKLLIDLLK
jgi:C_GCAxxG_C_C family probable redox protein